jgi:trans-2-enoyl-CoA reductase
VEKVLHVVNKKEVQNDYVFWKQKSAQERIDAIEILRLQYIQMQKDVQQRVQRVYTIIKRK